MVDIRWIGLGLIAAATAAGVTIFGRLGLTGVDTTLASTLRSIVMTLALVRWHSGTDPSPLWSEARRRWTPGPGWLGLLLVLAGTYLIAADALQRSGG